MADVTRATSLEDRRNQEGSTLNSPPQIIIKKENIGLELYQHQPYQYKLFNNMVQRDQYYEDLTKMKGRLAGSVPNMQQVIHTDMKRIKTNKIYERKLNYDLTGPRGLTWQFKQELQRLNSDERNVERDLMRLNRDLAKIAVSPSIAQTPSPYPNKDLSRSQTPCLSIIPDDNPIVSTLQRSKILSGRSFTTKTNKTTVNRFPTIHSKRSSISKSKSYNDKSPWIRKQNVSETDENRLYLQQHVHKNNQQKREIEQKLRKFLY